MSKLYCKGQVKVITKNTAFRFGQEDARTPIDTMLPPCGKSPSLTPVRSDLGPCAAGISPHTPVWCQHRWCDFPERWTTPDKTLKEPSAIIPPLRMAVISLKNYLLKPCEKALICETELSSRLRLLFLSLTWILSRTFSICAKYGKTSPVEMFHVLAG